MKLRIKINDSELESFLKKVNKKIKILFCSYDNVAVNLTVPEHEPNGLGGTYNCQ
jgi:hypothetical protein